MTENLQSSRMWWFDTGALDISKHSLEWKIKDFFSLPLEIGREIRSPEFKLADSRCVLKIWPRGMKGFDSVEWFGICLHKYDTQKHTGPIRFSIIKCGNIVRSCKLDCSENGLYRNDTFMEWSEFLALKSVIAPGGCLTIECKISHKYSFLEERGVDFYPSETTSNGFEFLPPLHKLDSLSQSGEYETRPIQSNIRSCLLAASTPEEPEVSLDSATEPSVSSSQSPNSTKAKCVKPPKSTEASSTTPECPTSRKQARGFKKMSQDFKHLYLTGEDSDLTFKVGGREYKVHKMILKARSPVFKNLLSQNLSLNSSGTICIDACDENAFHEFLLFVYSSEMENLSAENIYDIFFLAHSYDFPDLKEMCIEFMQNSFSVETICDVICLALKLDEKELLELATIFVAGHLKEVTGSVKWIQFLKENTNQGSELFMKAVDIGYVKVIA